MFHFIAFCSSFLSFCLFQFHLAPLPQVLLLALTRRLKSFLLFELKHLMLLTLRAVSKHVLWDEHTQNSKLKHHSRWGWRGGGSVDECLLLKREFKSLEHKKREHGRIGAVTLSLGSLVRHIGRRITGLAGYKPSFRFSREILSGLHTEWVHIPPPNTHR